MSQIPRTEKAQGTPAAFKHLVTTILAAPATTITFSGLSDGYRFFEVVGYTIVAGAAAAQIYARLNNDATAGVYEEQEQEGDGATHTAVRNTFTAFVISDSVTDVPANEPLHFRALIQKQTAGQRGQALVHAGDRVAASLKLQLRAVEWNNIADLISRIDVIASNNMSGAVVSVYGANLT